MRRAAKVDANHAEIVSALRSVGASVQSIAMVGGGCPDLLIGYAGLSFVLEIKDGAKPPSRRELTPDEAAWHAAWRGHAAVVTSVDEALREIGVTDCGRASRTNTRTYRERVGESDA